MGDLTQFAILGIFVCTLFSLTSISIGMHGDVLNNQSQRKYLWGFIGGYIMMALCGIAAVVFSGLGL